MINFIVGPKGSGSSGKHNGIPDYYVDEYLNKHLYNKCIVLQQNQGLRVL